MSRMRSTGRVLRMCRHRRRQHYRTRAVPNQPGPRHSTRQSDHFTIADHRHRLSTQRPGRECHNSCWAGPRARAEQPLRHGTTGDDNRLVGTTSTDQARHPIRWTTIRRRHELVRTISLVKPYRNRQIIMGPRES